MNATLPGPVVGTQPWLPWPLCRWKSWTEPVRAERLAALRIGVAMIALLDVLTTFLPRVHDFFGPDSLARFARRDLFGYYTEAPRWNWSLFRGLGQPANLIPISFIAAALGLWVLAGFAERRDSSANESRVPLSRRIVVWALLTTLALLGFASRLFSTEDSPLGTVDLEWLWGPWDANPTALWVAMLVLVAALVLMLFGCLTRLAVLLAWVLMISFDNLNPYLGNQGDVVRAILFLYLVLTPCGAAWSLDRWQQRRRTGDDRPVYVQAWWLRLLFLQLIVIYFFNGLYKLFGADWHAGASLYYVMASPTLSRVSYAEFTTPFWFLQAASYLVLVWEAGFPVWVAFRWTRTPALVLGVLFHLGIWATMELGFFGAYMLCMYLPLVPWERWTRTGRAPV
jgi:hypothetical protein